jgi:Signal transduction histidine kinase
MRPRDRVGTGPRGTGLGLAICRSIMQSHGGEVSYRATPGGGATFVVRFPLAERGPHEIAPADAPAG